MQPVHHRERVERPAPREAEDAERAPEAREGAHGESGPAPVIQQTLKCVGPVPKYFECFADALLCYHIVPNMLSYLPPSIARFPRGFRELEGPQVQEIQHAAGAAEAREAPAAQGGAEVHEVEHRQGAAEARDAAQRQRAAEVHEVQCADLLPRALRAFELWNRLLHP